MIAPHPDPASSPAVGRRCVPPGRPNQPNAPNVPNAQPNDASFSYTVVAPAPMRPPGPYPGPPPPAPPHRSGPVVPPPVTRVLVAGLSLVTVVLGVTLPGPLGSGWDAFLAWTIFAALCALSVLAGGATDRREWSWRLQLYGTLGLLLFWVIAARPIAVSNIGFLLTLGVALAVLSTVRNPFRPPWRAIFGSAAAPRR